MTIAEDGEIQVFVQGPLPVQPADGDSVIIHTNGLSLVDGEGVDRLRLTPKAGAPKWWQLDVRGGDGRFWKAGVCHGGMQRGRVDRPIVLKSIKTIVADAAGVDE